MRRVTAAAVCLLGVGSGLIACGGQPAVCDDMDALRASVNDLQNVEVGNNAVSTLTTALQKIQSDLKQLKQDGSDQYSAEIDALENQLTTLRSSLKTASTNPSAASFTEVTNGVKAVGTAVTDLGDAVSSTCQ